MKKRFLFFIMAILIAGLYFMQFVSASSEMDTGMALFKKHEYKAALRHFIQEVKMNPNDCNALYYEAVTFHQLKDVDQAKLVYLKIMKGFPGTPAAVNANAALMYLDPVYAKQHQQMSTRQQRPTAHSDSYSATPGGAPAETASDIAGLPDQVRIPFQKKDKIILFRHLLTVAR